MSIKETILQVAVAALAAVGFYGILHALLEALLTPRELAVAVILTKAISPEELDILLCEARRAPCGGGKRVVLVLPPDLWETCIEETGAYIEILEKHGATVSLACRSIPPRQ